MAHRLRARLMRLLAGLAALVSTAVLANGPSPDSVKSVSELCDEIGNKLGSVSVRDCDRQDLSDSGYFSVLGRPLAVKVYAPKPPKRPLGRILMIGGTHGDEYSSVSVMFKWMDILNKHHSGLFHWHVVPLANPDGLLRKSSQRQNERGVDLNRNFPTSDWEALSNDYWVRRTGRDPRRYPGPTAASEPETQFMIGEIESFQPDIIISLHAPYGLIDHDGPPEAPERVGRLSLRRLGVFPGSLGNYGGVDKDVPVVTVELTHAGIMPSRGEISRMWTDLVRWLIRERKRKNG